jgi:hypothetical protein
VFLLCDSDGRADIFDVLEHENRVLLYVFEFLEEQKRLFIVTETSLDAVSRGTVTYEHGIILPVIVVDLVLLKGGRKHFPRRVF